MITEKKWIQDISRQRLSPVSLGSYLAYAGPEDAAWSLWRTWKIAECWKPACLPWGHCHEKQSAPMAEISERQPHQGMENVAEIQKIWKAGRRRDSTKMAGWWKTLALTWAEIIDTVFHKPQISSLNARRAPMLCVCVLGGALLRILL